MLLFYVLQKGTLTKLAHFLKNV